MAGYANLDRLIKKQLADGIFAGAGVLISKKGETVFSEEYGFADKEKSIPINKDTIYRIYSMTKPVTAVAMMILYEQGFFRLDDAVGRWLPGFSNQKILSVDKTGNVSYLPVKNPMTIRHLLTMTSGLPYHWDDSITGREIKQTFDRLTSQLSNEDISLGASQEINTVSIANELGKIPLVFQPGEHWLYGLSHDIAGALIEIFTGKKLGEALKEMIFDPLDMKDTGFFLSSEQKQRLSVLYSPSADGSLIPNSIGLIDWDPAIQPVFEQAGAGLFSTITDYGRFAAMLTGQGETGGVRLIGRKTIEFFSSDHLCKNLRQEFVNSTGMKGYSYGLGVRTMINPAASGINGTVGEFGWEGAAGSWFCIDPLEEMYAIYMVQRLPGEHRINIPPLMAAIYGCL